MFKWIEGHVDTGYTRSDITGVHRRNRQAGHTMLALAIGYYREKCEKSTTALYEVMGHYRENDSRKNTNVLSSKYGWIGKEQMTAQYKARVDDHTRQCVYRRGG